MLKNKWVIMSAIGALGLATLGIVYFKNIECPTCILQVANQRFGIKDEDTGTYGRIIVRFCPECGRIVKRI